MPGRISALVVVGLLALVAVGCGGGDTAAMEVPGPPADVSIPQSDTPPADAAASQGNDSGSATATPTATPDSSTGASTDTGASTGTDTGTTTDSGGGTAAPDTSTDSETNDTPPPDGSDAQQFEDFCAQNPGAC
jgi:hypothetical protein